MNVFVFICILFCGVIQFNYVSGSISNPPSLSSVHKIRNGYDIQQDVEEIKINKKGFGKKRTRRYSSSSASDTIASAFGKVDALIDSLKQSYLTHPITRGKFTEGTVRSYDILKTSEGNYIFGSLNGDLNQSFKSLIARRPRTGDIISCRIPSSRMAEHYMMVLNSNKVIDVGVRGGKSSHDGTISLTSFRKSSYYNSTECLFHENRVIARAGEIDDEKGDDTETDLKTDEILDRINCTISGKTQGNFHYDLLSCNCQDVVLYWAYGYAESNCISAFGCNNYLMYNFNQIFRYVDEKAFHFYQEHSFDNFLLDAGLDTLVSHFVYNN